MRNDTMIIHDGMSALTQELGIVEAEKFIALILREPFDYTEWRKKLWPGKSAQEIFEAATEYEKKYGE